MMILILVQGLLRVTLEQLGRYDGLLSNQTLVNAHADIRRAFVGISQVMERHEAKTD